MSGVYQCEASGVEGRVKSAQVHVNIQYPPGIVTIAPGHDTFFTKRGGQPVHDITCEADCQPKCTYSWYRKGDRQRYTKGNRLFASKTYNYGGTSRFHCYATNDIEPYAYNYSRLINVEVKDGPDNVTIIPNSSAIENKPFQLLCSASCNPVCQSYNWYHNGRRGDQGTQVLTFHHLSKDDSGDYQCRVTDYYGTTYSEYYTINVPYAPENVTIQYSSWYDHLIEGQDYITLTCNADCNPECSYLFYQNGKLMNNAYTWRPIYRNMSGRYTCSAKNSIVDMYRISSNFVTINTKYKPTMTSSKNKTTITAPDLLDLTFSVDSFPSSNVTIFHETKTLIFLPNVTGQLSYNVSIESCLDHGKYRVEVVNDAGSDRFTLIADVECSPIVVRHSNVAHKEFRVGDLLHLTVIFMANPTAEVLWSFVPWNQNTSLEVQTQQIQTHKESTKLVLILSDTDKFGKYILELKNELGKINKEFNIQGPIVAATKTDPGTTISSRDSDSDGDLSMSPTSWKGKTNALRETEMNTFLLQQDKLHEEVQKLRLEGDVLRLKRNYYVIKLQVLMKEHPDIIDEVFGED
ncbi:carcinoembryonic antigen-related cell adhesion molecule 5 [Magallana gigas]|uniref:carcinoembryonic antigen-related cell adhesion molecule 5 n=1 Tax=Magallana gigas TaxID=29159 RepID=UPI003341440C